MDKVIIDTDVLIDYSKNKGDLLDKLINLRDQGKTSLYVNPVIVAEFFTDRNLRSSSKYQKALEFIGFFEVVDLTKKVGLLAGKIMMEGKIEFTADALIAASCIVGGMKLATRNKRHFEKVKELELFN